MAKNVFILFLTNQF